MLNKSILLNLQIAKNDMGTLLGLIITCMVLFMITANNFLFPSNIFILLVLILYLVFYIRIANKVFFASLFDNEGTMYMTLPISAKDMVLGKVLAVSGYFTIAQIILVLGMMGGIFLAGVSTADVLSALVSEVPSLEGTAAELTITFGLLPLSVFAEVLFSSTLLLTVFLKLGMKKKKLMLCWILYWLISGILNTALETLGKALGNMAFGGAISSIFSIIFYLSLSWLLIRYCIKQLETAF